ncbi:MAG: response regulator receiver modulated metal dependent phosphohydrolase [Candidatus Magnetoglobus multicellularis str. Araruama]|uniref:Response regulator receiver modulated metal dependent phosphohydrolase n=1 Tax=Candidatus Magnetoglobus multicellularis str. Araruama TaxID=890399 RepID=A0A1V1PAY0_9BACT|nr:MAG: response regulator receiver modulated metal dependent phosphohydrolase [Candidatus Magnetoglobus multicellularis str. Araruama]
MSQLEDNGLFSDDDIIFADETDEELTVPDDIKRWKILIVDDEAEVHTVTRMVLDDFQFEGRGVTFMSAYSGAEAKKVIEENPDCALILLDVVMETNDSGLEVVRYIREELKNQFVRIILRTGQPGQAPEREIITQYDINDYKMKSLLTEQSLFTTITSAIRSFRDINIIERNRKGLEQILKSSVSLFRLQSLKQFANGALTQLSSLLGLDDQLYLHASGFTATQDDGQLKIIAGTGKFENCLNQPINKVVPDKIRKLLDEATETQNSIISNTDYVGHFTSRNGSKNFLYMGDYNQHLSNIEKDMIRVFTSNVAIALDNIYLNREVVDTQKEVVITLGEVVETRSKETAHHVRRVAEYSYKLALMAGIDEYNADLIRLASPMHDVGKIGIPDTILNKPGRLTHEEFEIIKTHTLIGYDILKHSDREIMRAAANIALEHHERWNGKGYPQLLKGDKIHIFGRITGLLDVFDALSYKRVYKDAWPLDKIIDLIKAERGEHFDPTLVDLFLGNLDVFLAIKEAYPEEDEDLETSK